MEHVINTRDANIRLNNCTVLLSLMIDTVQLSSSSPSSFRNSSFVCIQVASEKGAASGCTWVENKALESDCTGVAWPWSNYCGGKYIWRTTVQYMWWFRKKKKHGVRAEDMANPTSCEIILVDKTTCTWNILGQLAVLISLAVNLNILSRPVAQIVSYTSFFPIFKVGIG